MKNGLIVALAALVLALGGYGIWQMRVVSGLQNQYDALVQQAEAGKLIGKASTEKDREIEALEKRVAELDARLAGRNGGAESAAGTSSGDAAKEKEEKEGSGEFLKGIARMLEDPGMQGILEQQNLVTVNGMYGDLFRELNLTEDAEETFRQLLLDRQTAATKIGMQLLDKSKSPEERKEIAADFKKETERLTGEIKGALGDEAYKEFKLFEDSQQERQQLNAYKQALSANNMALPFEVEEKLMTAMYDVRKEFKFSTDYGNDSNPDADAILKFNKEAAEKYIEEYRTLQGRIYERAEGILDPGQLETFRESQDGMRKMQEMGMKMSLGFMGEGTE